MQSKNIVTKLALAMIMLLPMSLLAQNSSINTFSPYTFYGLGDLSTPGTTYLRGMGGAGVAFRSPMAINYLNPAASSAMGQKSVIFNFGMEGQNIYNKSASTSTSYNTFNVRDVAIQFPLAKRLGFTFSMNPYSSVGYRVEQQETDENIIAKLGDVIYQYQGEGNITQFKGAIGWEVFKNFSLGAEMIYYLGNIDRAFNSVITPITQTGSYNNMSGSDNLFVSKLNAGFGFQYTPLLTEKRMVTIGATYTMKSNLNPTIDRYIHSNNIFGDTVSYTTNYPDMKVPNILSGGVSYVDDKWLVNADYVFQGWGESNKNISYTSETGSVVYKNTNAFKVGAEYTPNRGDVRRFYKRMSYRVGFRYSDNYLKFNGENLNDKAVTLGVGIPVKMFGTTKINVGLEAGQRGTVRSNLIRERYFKFSIGLSLFGEYWFMKYKYD